MRMELRIEVVMETKDKWMEVIIEDKGMSNNQKSLTDEQRETGKNWK